MAGISGRCFCGPGRDNFIGHPLKWCAAFAEHVEPLPRLKLKCSPMKLIYTLLHLMTPACTALRLIFSGLNIYRG